MKDLNDWLEQELNRKKFLQASILYGIGGSALVEAARASAAAPSPATILPKQPKHTLVVAQGTPQADLAPNTTGNGTQALTCVYEGLTDVIIPNGFMAAKTQLNTRGIHLVPMLAEHWEFSKNREVVRFNLRKNARSPYGNLLTADDILWSAGAWLGAGFVAKLFLSLAGFTNLNQLTAIDAHTVELSLPAPPPTYFLSLFSLTAFISIYDSTEVKKHVTGSDPFGTQWLTQNTAGFGPYQVASNTATGDRTVFTVNPGYWGVKPKITEVTRLTVTEDGSRLQLLLSGQADLVDGLTVAELDQVAKNKNFAIRTYTTTRQIMIGMDNTVPPFNDVNIRRSIARAIPYNNIIEFVYHNRVRRWKTCIVPWYPGATDAFWKYDTDLAAAKLGLASLKGETLTLYYGLGSLANQQACVLIQNSLRAAGVDIQLQGLDASTFQVKRLTGQLPFVYDDVDNPIIQGAAYDLQAFYGSHPLLPLLKYQAPPALDQLIAKIGTTTDHQKANRLIRQAQSIIVPAMPMIPIAWVGSTIAAKRNLVGIRAHAFAQPYYQDLHFT